VVPGFEVRGLLDEGGMGRVYAARALGLDRDVALKVARESAEADPAGIARFLDEARLMGGLEHPAVVPLFQLVTTDGGRPCLVMQPVRGLAWSRLMREPGRTQEQELRVLLRVCEGVAFLHSRGVVHRDLKPGNVMVDRFGQVQIIDFGLALRLPQPVAPVAGAAARAGTPVYMAPEQAACRADLLGTRTDVYLLGAILYEILTGRPPHHREDDAGSGPKEAIRRVLRRASDGDVIPPAQAVAAGTDVPADLGDACARALARDPADRFETVERFAEAVRECLRRSEDRSRSAALVGQATAEMDRAAAPRMRPAARAEALAAAESLLEQALTVWPGNPQAASALAKVHRGLAADALRREEYYLATFSAGRVAELDLEDGPRDAEFLRRQAFRGLYRRYLRLRSAVFFSFWSSLANIASAGWGAAASLGLLAGALPGPSLLSVAPVLLVLLAIQVVPSVALLWSCARVWRGYEAEHQRAVGLATFVLFLAIAAAPSILYLWTLGSDWTFLVPPGELARSAVLLAVTAGFSLAAVRSWTSEDLERLPWLVPQDAHPDAADRRRPGTNWARSGGPSSGAPVADRLDPAQLCAGISACTTLALFVPVWLCSVPAFAGAGPRATGLALVASLAAVAVGLARGAVWARFWGIVLHLVAGLGLATLASCRGDAVLVAGAAAHLVAAFALVKLGTVVGEPPRRAHLVPATRGAGARLLLFAAVGLTWLHLALGTMAAYWDGAHRLVVMTEAVESECFGEASVVVDGGELRLSCSSWDRARIEREAASLSAAGSELWRDPWRGIGAVRITNGRESVRVPSGAGANATPADGP
jgi:hypothetical protein